MPSIVAIAAGRVGAGRVARALGGGVVLDGPIVLAGPVELAAPVELAVGVGGAVEVHPANAIPAPRTATVA